MKYSFRCNCPITSALDILGDRWMLVIIKQMLIEGKQTFKDFVESDEAIATNILASKLKLLEETDLITKHKLPDNKKTNVYQLTEKAIALSPVIVELANWSDQHLRGVHATIVNGEEMHSIRQDKHAFTKLIESKYREKLLPHPKPSSVKT